MDGMDRLKFLGRRNPLDDRSCVRHGYGTLYDVGGTGILGAWYTITVCGTWNSVRSDTDTCWYQNSQFFLATWESICVAFFHLVGPTVLGYYS